jgi:2-polyprenyl-3-methyl-5-hydroxy-6-metoxy-1,4-benzoquinol methylase
MAATPESAQAGSAERPAEAAAPALAEAWASLARAEAHAGAAPTRPGSRLGLLGVWVRRLVGRLTRFQVVHQAEYNRAVLEALHDLDGGLKGLSRGLEQVVGQSLPAVAHQLGEVSRTVEQMVGASLPGLGQQLAEVSRTVEQMVSTSLPGIAEHLAVVSRTVQELQQAHGGMFETQKAQGRHLDHLAGEAADYREEITGRVEEGERAAEAFESRVAAETRKLAAAVADLEQRFRPNLHFDTFDFARRHRGDEEELTRRMHKYAVLFGPVQRVLDVGCGRGEFLQACREAGVGAYGVESDPEMVSRCSMKALEVVAGDALEHLRGLEDRSLDGIFMAQVVEHLTSAEIVEFVRLAADKLKRGARIIIETINPDTFSALRWFWMDPTHRQPVSAATLRFLLEDAGFVLRDVLYASPVPEEEALQRLPEAPAAASGEGVADLVRAWNRNVDKLNRVLFGDQDYAVIAER